MHHPGTCRSWTLPRRARRSAALAAAPLLALAGGLLLARGARAQQPDSVAPTVRIVQDSSAASDPGSRLDVPRGLSPTQQRDSAGEYYHRAQVQLARPEARIPSPGNILSGITVVEDALRILGRDHVSLARRELRRSLAFDSAYGPAAMALASLALDSRDKEQLREAGQALRRARSSPGSAGELAFLEAKIGELLGDSSGLEGAERFVAAGGDPAIGALLRAKALFAAGRDSLAGVVYFRGVPTASDSAAAAYFRDLGPVADAGDEARWNILDGPAKAAWLRSFWAKRAARSGMTPEEIVAEHYRRLRVAAERYPRRNAREPQSMVGEAIVHDPLPTVDDRGLIYILHGEPDRIVKTVSEGCSGNESWLYATADGRSIYHFAAPRRANEFYLVSDPLAACRGAKVLDLVQALEDRREIDARYGIQADRLRMAVSSPGSLDLSSETASYRNLVNEARRAAEDGLREATYFMQPFESLPFYYDTYAFQGDSGQTHIIVAAAVPAAQVPAHVEASGVIYPLHLKFIAYDTAQGRSFLAESTWYFRSRRRLEHDENLRLTLELDNPPGSPLLHTIRLQSVGTDLASAYGGPLPLREFKGDTLMISDLVLAEAAGKGWRRGDVELGLVPPRQFGRAPISLFYELYNVPAAADCVTSMRVVRLGGRGLPGVVHDLFAGRAALSFSFTEMARPKNGVLQVLRQVDLKHLSPGAYRLEVEASVEGRTVRRQSEFVVSKKLDLD